MLKCSSCLGLSVISKYFVSVFPTSICICLNTIHHTGDWKPTLHFFQTCDYASFVLNSIWLSDETRLRMWHCLCPGRQKGKQEFHLLSQKTLYLTFHSSPAPTVDCNIVSSYVHVWTPKHVCILGWQLSLWLSTCLACIRHSILSPIKYFPFLSVIFTFA